MARELSKGYGRAGEVGVEGWGVGVEDGGADR